MPALLRADLRIPDALQLRRSQERGLTGTPAVTKSSAARGGRMQEKVERRFVRFDSGAQERRATGVQQPGSQGVASPTGFEPVF